MRAAATVALVLLGYAYTHQWFARFDAFVAAHSLRALGFHVTAVGTSGLTVHAGRQFDVTAIVTGSCSSALAGPLLTLVTLALGILVLWRAILGRDELKHLSRRA